ncbi:MAG: single-stranded DNA-binding protein, partial [Oscillospiraceae bacterium]
WRGTADFVTRYFHKGSMIAVQGAIQTHSYEDKNGNKRVSTEIVADNVSFCGSKSESGTAAPRRENAAPAYQGGDSGSFSVLPEGDDGFPFGSSNEDDGLPF